MSLNVLLVDDDDFFLNEILIPTLPQLLRSLSISRDIIQHIAYNGIEGLLKYSEIKPDIVFTDYQMPIMDGECFVSQILLQEHQPQSIYMISNEDFINLKKIPGVSMFIRKQDIFCNFFQEKRRKLI